MATFPDTGNKNVRVTRMRTQGVTRSPFNKKVKVYDWNVARWSLEMVLPPMAESNPDVATWLQFFEDLNGMEDTFTVDIARYVPHLAGPVNVVFRLTSSTYDYSFDDNRMFNFSLSAVEDLA